ncbi:MAG: 8-oxo-dGTP diphosphatase MutT [Legionellaceae bacterium]|nr:8-oxo-dGTP diphosphatase MutT [Legionellaceae bacterium]HCA89564.1 8-oxo-dGTP diphosphatase MutT [Legionellales bacterium]|tara:strand:- start:412 stop:798 length:387 start_codon:yes stop_codon:yes gene_type:complete
MDVAVGVIINAQQQVLITQRPPNVDCGGQWEFPGGKIEPGERPTQALTRELKEELGIESIDASFLFTITIHSDTQLLKLHVYLVNSYKGQPTCCEQQEDLRWVAITHLKKYDFPKANHKILQYLAGQF